MTLAPRLLVLLSAFVARTLSAQPQPSQSAMFAPVVGLSGGSASGEHLIGAFVTLGFQTPRMDARFSAEAAAFLGACADDRRSECGTSSGAYFDVALGRRFVIMEDRRTSWQAGIGPSKGPRGAWFVSPYAEVQLSLVGAVIMRLGARYRYGIAADRQWYGPTPPRTTAIYMSVGLADAGR